MAKGKKRQDRKERTRIWEESIINNNEWKHNKISTEKDKNKSQKEIKTTPFNICSLTRGG
jgi:hypothetical protein